MDRYPDLPKLSMHAHVAGDQPAERLPPMPGEA
jgi:hypothetical protein